MCWMLMWMCFVVVVCLCYLSLSAIHFSKRFNQIKIVFYEYSKDRCNENYWVNPANTNRDGICTVFGIFLFTLVVFVVLIDLFVQVLSASRPIRFSFDIFSDFCSSILIHINKVFQFEICSNDLHLMFLVIVALAFTAKSENRNENNENKTVSTFN